MIKKQFILILAVLAVCLVMCSSEIRKEEIKASIEGVVTDNNTGEKLANVEVNVLPAAIGADIHHKTQTDKHGRFLVENLKKGTYGLSFDKDGYIYYRKRRPVRDKEEYYYSKAIRTVYLEKGEQAFEEIKLAKGAIVLGLVHMKDETGSHPPPLKKKSGNHSKAFVRFFWYSGGEWLYYDGATVGTDGYYRFNGLELNGEYDVEFLWQGFAHQIVRLNVLKTGEINLNQTFDGLNKTAVSVRLYYHDKLTEGVVELIDISRNRSIGDFLEKENIHLLKGVKPGKYKLRITLTDDGSTAHEEDFYRQKEELIEVQPGITNVLEFKY